MLKKSYESRTVRKDLLMAVGSIVLSVCYNEPLIRDWVSAHPWVIAAIGNLFAVVGIKLRWGTNRKLSLR